jgi:type VI secretion system protein ImpK
MSQQGLGRVVGDFLATVLLYRSADPNTLPDAAGMRARLIPLLDAISTKPDARAISADDLELARFALVAWADEALINSAWPGRESWRSQPLQLEVFRTNRAGNEFFTRLGTLRPEQRDVREVYFLCLALGFQGQYAGQEAERHEVVRQQYEALRQTGRARDLAVTAPLAPAAYDLEIEFERAGARGAWVPVAVWAGLALATFGALWGVLSWGAGQLPTPGA